MDGLFTLIDSTRQVIAENVTRDEMFYLRGLERLTDSRDLTSVRPSLVEKTRRPYLWVSLVSAAELRATLRHCRKRPEHQTPGRWQAEDSRTGDWEIFRTSRGMSRVFAFHSARANAYRMAA